MLGLGSTRFRRGGVGAFRGRHKWRCVLCVLPSSSEASNERRGWLNDTQAHMQEEWGELPPPTKIGKKETPRRARISPRRWNHQRRVSFELDIEQNKRHFPAKRRLESRWGRVASKFLPPRNCTQITAILYASSSFQPKKTPRVKTLQRTIAMQVRNSLLALISYGGSAQTREVPCFRRL